MNNIDRKIRSSLDAGIKAGAAADGCRYRFKAIDRSEVDEHRLDFALAVAAWATVELGGKRVPPICWFKAAGSERADWGSDSWAGYGFMDGPTGEVWLSADMPNRNLVEAVAHETFHAIKHEKHDVSAENEREAYQFGRRVAEKWALPDAPCTEVFVVKTRADLPWRAAVGSTAFASDEMVIYRASHRGTPRSPRWVEHRHFGKGGIMRRYYGGNVRGMVAVGA